MLTTIAIAVVLGTTEQVPLSGGVSPDGAWEVALEADHDSPRFREYEFKGGDEQFPAFLVVDRGSRAVLGRIPWPGAASEKEVLLRDRTQVKWRSDSTAVAINTRDAFYAQSLVLVRKPQNRRFTDVPLPPYAELSGHARPPDEKVRPRGRNIAIRWTAEGYLIFETWLWGDVEYPLSYRVSLRLKDGRLEVQDRQPIMEGTPPW